VESRQELVKLQAGDSENLAIWKKLIDLSKVEFDAVYSRLDIEFDNTLGKASTTRGFSHCLMNCAKKVLLAKVRAQSSCTFEEDSLQLKGESAMIQKSDGASQLRDDRPG